MKEWKSLAKLAEVLLHNWGANQNKIDLRRGMEVVAMERVEWAARRAAIEDLFIHINQCIDEAKEEEEEEEDDDRDKVHPRIRKRNRT